MKLITFSLFGDKEIYCKGAVENARLAKEIYPGWTARFYIADDVPEEDIEQIRSHGAQVVRCKRRGVYDGLIWRFRPLIEDDVEVWVSRDCDSRLNHREKAAVDEWMQTDKSLHVMRDAFNHTYPIMAGMFGVNNTLFHARYGKIDFENKIKLGWYRLLLEFRTSKRSSVRSYLKPFVLFLRTLHTSYSKSRESDQKLLEETVWKAAMHDHLCHDHWDNTTPIGRPTDDLVAYVTTRSRKPKISYPEGQDNRPFPPHKPMQYGLYIGQRIDENNNAILTTDTRSEYELRGVSYK